MLSSPKLSVFTILLFLSLIWTPLCRAKTSSIDITQQIYLNPIFNENHMDWRTRGRPSIDEIAASGDGKWVAFKVTLGNPTERRLYLIHNGPSGWGPVEDITASLPGPVDSGFKLKYLQFNHDGSRLFFVWNWLNDIHCWDAGGCRPVVNEISKAQEEKPYALNRDGTMLFFRDTRFNETQQKSISGLYFVEVGNEPKLLFDYQTLPCEAASLHCSAWASRLKLLDCSLDGSTVFFRWVMGESPYDPQSMFKLAVSGGMEVYPEEAHDTIWESRLRNRIVSENGDAVLYAYTSAGEPRRLYLVSSGRKILLGKTTDVNGFAYPSLSQDGRSARFYGRGYFMHTLWSDGMMRDSFSEWIHSDGDAFAGRFMATDLIADTSPASSAATPKYFTASQASGVDIIHEVVVGRHHQGPQVLQIYYDRWPLLIDDEKPLTVYASLRNSGPDGLENIEWVRMHSLVDGLEQKDWQLINPAWHNTPPIYCQRELYDDGVSGGDQVAGDGVYTNNTIEPRLDSGFYNQHGLPAYPGIRIIVKTKSHQYAIADSYLKVRRASKSAIIPQLWLLLNDE